MKITAVSTDLSKFQWKKKTPLRRYILKVCTQFPALALARALFFFLFLVFGAGAASADSSCLDFSSSVCMVVSLSFSNSASAFCSASCWANIAWSRPARSCIIGLGCPSPEPPMEPSSLIAMKLKPSIALKRKVTTDFFWCAKATLKNNIQLYSSQLSRYSLSRYFVKLTYNYSKHLQETLLRRMFLKTGLKVCYSKTSWLSNPKLDCFLVANSDPGVCVDENEYTYQWSL